MKKLLTIIAAVALSGNAALGQTVISSWTFETSVPTTAGPHTAEEGVAPGQALGFHAAAATTYSNPSGNGSAESFSSNNWAIGDYYQFSVSTMGFTDVMLSWDQTRSNTGPETFDLLYSTDGGSTFSIGLDDYTVDAITWSATTPQAGSMFTLNLSSITALNNNANVVFRLVAETAGSATAGSNRVDNFTVTAIPEPSTYMLLGVGLLFAAQRFRRSRQS